MLAMKSWSFARQFWSIGGPLLGLLAWDVAVVLGYEVFHFEWIAARNIPLAMYGSAIGIVVGFRNQSAYSRWWEARTIWGSIVNNSRSLARQLVAALSANRRLEDHDQAEMLGIRNHLVYHQIAFAHALRQQLRGLDPLPEIRGLLNERDLACLVGQKNVSLTLQQNMGRMLREARERGWLNYHEWQSMDRNLDDLMDAQGGAERIKNTPLPKQYDFFPMLFVHIYCVLLPIGMVEQLHWFTPLGSALIGFMFLALDKIGRDLESPFENVIYDVPLTAITRTIEINLRQLIGEKELPEPVQPVGGVLW